jgi:hypothetical protein
LDAVYAGYHEGGGSVVARAEPLVDAAIGATLPWLAASLRRSLGTEREPASERRRGHDAALAALSRLRARSAHRDAWIAWTREALERQ